MSFKFARDTHQMMGASRQNRNYRKPRTSSLSDDDSEDPLQRPPAAASAFSYSQDLGGNICLPRPEGGGGGDGGDFSLSAESFSSYSEDLGGKICMALPGGGGGGGGEEDGGDFSLSLGAGTYDDSIVPGSLASKGGGHDAAVSQNFSPQSNHSFDGSVETAVPLRPGSSQKGAVRIASGVGYEMLRSMGWRENTGLGQSSDGIVDPILPTSKPNHLGIGFNPTAEHEAAQEKIRKLQLAKQEDRDQKLKLQLDKAELAEEEYIFMRESAMAVPSTSYEHVSEVDARLQGISPDLHLPILPAALQGQKSTEPGQCPHCRRRFDTKHALKSHIHDRHARLQHAAKRQFKRERRKGGKRSPGANNISRTRGSARNLAPMSQNFSVYD